jgi:hypothetical protein
LDEEGKTKLPCTLDKKPNASGDVSAPAPWLHPRADAQQGEHPDDSAHGAPWLHPVMAHNESGSGYNFWSQDNWVFTGDAEGTEGVGPMGKGAGGARVETYTEEQKPAEEVRA